MLHKFIAYFLSFSMIFTQTAWAFNDVVPPQNIGDNPINHIVVDPDRAGNTHLDRAQNGTPVININAASQGGVSANYYRDFNVDEQNLILNNLQGEAGISNLGGALHGNPNMNVPGAKAADIILNEVTSNRVSNINGYTETFGKQAELIIANPNGIMVGGAGFINTSRLSLVTGKSTGLDANGNLNPFMLSDNPNAVISVVGRDVVDADGRPVAYNLGIDMSSGNYVDLLSRVVQINGNILSGGAVNIKTGNDKATRGADGEWIVTSTDKADKPEFAIDSTALGGIYAGRVNIIASEDGVGVRSRGDVIANMDDIKYDARGNILISGENSAARDIKINADKIINSAEITAKNNIAITANELENTGGQIVAVNDLNLDFGANDWTSSGVFHSGGTLSLAANNFTNIVDDFSGKNIAINAIGNITNYGTIKADNNLSLTSGGSIINGLVLGSDATMHAGGDLSATAATNILNRGFIQALGELSLKTNSAINNDYDLDDKFKNLSDANSGGSMSATYQAQYNNLSNITDIATLNTLAKNVKASAQYEAVQSRIRVLHIQDLLNTNDAYSSVNVETLSESDLLQLMEDLQGADYVAEDWSLDITAQITDIDADIAAQQNECDQYNSDNGTTLSREDYADIMGEEFLDRSTLIADAKSTAETSRLDAVKTLLNERTTLVAEYKTLNFANMGEEDVLNKLAVLLEGNFNEDDWYLPEMPVSPAENALNDYIASLRIANINRTNVEQTGIHNDGRIYSGGNMSLVSNSVLHNNKGALIYSDGNADFNVRDILFNNSNALGTGIYANGTMNTSGYNNGRLSKLINYDGTIESNGNLSVNANDVINYGSDKTDAELRAGYQVSRIWVANRVGGGTWVTTDRDVANWRNGFVASDSSMLRSNNGTLSIVADNTTNYNGKIFGFNVDIRTGNLLNLTKSIKIGLTNYITYEERYCKWKVFGKCMDHGWRWRNTTSGYTQTLVGNSTAQIIASGDLKIQANRIGNGTSAIGSIGNNNNLPYAPMVQTETPLQEIVRTGTIDPLANFKQPNGKYGVIRNGDFLNGHYLYESDPLLVDLEHYLGSQYFMNRLGIDPSDVESKFMGDAFVEHEIIKKSMEQIQVFQNTQMTTEQQDEYINNLYNALTSEKVADLGLEFGKQLTAEQIAKLDTDIVWYVRQEVTLPNGEKVEVLVPQVFLAQSTLNELYGAALAREDVQTSIRGNNVTIQQLTEEADSILNNMGLIVGNRELVITTDELNNAAMSVGGQQPVLRGGDLLAINTGTLNNLSGAISGGEVNINADEINNITLAQRETLDRGNYKKIETNIADTATIASTGDMNITTTGDVNMAGSKIASGGDIDLNVGGDLNSTSIQDYEYEYRKTTESGILSKKTTTDITESTKNIGSEISSGGDMKMDVDGNATFAGTTINTGGSADLDVDGNTTITAVTDYDYSYHNTDKSSWGGLVKEKHIVEDSATKLQGADVNIQQGLTINTGNNLNLIASDVNVGGNADIDAGMNINITSADEVSQHYELHEKTNIIEDLAKAVGELALAVGTGGASLLVVNDSFDASCTGGSCGVNVTLGTSEKDENTTRNTTAIGSSINVGGDLSMDAENDINIRGSDLNVGGDGAVTAGNNINILESQNTSGSSSSHEDTKITAGASVGNSYVDAGFAADGLVKAGELVKSATDALDEMKELRAAGKASDEAVRDAELNLAMATANLVNAELAMASSIAGAAAAASTSFGTGMYAAGSVNYETNKNSSSASSTTSNASNIFGDNITFTSGNDMLQSGSNVGANDTITYNVENDLNVIASQDTYETKSSSDSFNASVSVGNNGVSVNAGYNESENRGRSTTNNNSNVIADNIVINTGNDATFAGANVNADTDLTMEIGGDLTVESKQDTDYAKGNNWGVNGGIGTNGNVNAGFNTGSSNHDSAWVNDQTDLTGGNVNINVDGKTIITGGMIAAVDENGNDTGNLNLATNELEYNDIKDFNTSEESGFGFSTSFGKSNDKDEWNAHPSGTTTVSMTDKGSETEQTTHATIGGGNITVGGTELAENDSSLAGLNRDTNNAQVITKDEITGALDGSMTVDNRLLTEEGRAEIANQHEHLVDNTIIAGAGAYGTVEGAVKFVGDVAGVNGPEYDKNGNIVETDAINNWKANQSGMATGIRRGGDDKTQEIIGKMKDGFVSPEDLQTLAEMTSDGSVNLVYSNDSETITFLDKDGNVLGAIARSGFNDLTNQQGYVNLANGAGTDAYTFLRTDAEERAHNYVGASETAAGKAANNEMSYYNTVANLTGGYTVSQSQYGAGIATNAQAQYNQQYNGNTNNLLLTNNQSAAAVTGPTTDSRTFLGTAGGAATGAAIGSAVPVIGTVAGAVVGGLVFGGLGLAGDINEYEHSDAVWENMSDEQRANYSSKEAFQARGILTISVSTLENESDMLKAAIPVAYDTPVIDPLTGKELPMSGVVYQVGNKLYYSANQLSDAKDANYNAQAWAWTEIGLAAAPVVAGATAKGVSAVGNMSKAIGSSADDALRLTV